MLTTKEKATLRDRIEALSVEHRDLDDVIEAISVDGYVDELQIKRLKKRKLLLKDNIERMKSLLIPDLNA